MLARNLDLMVAEGDLLQARSGLYPSVNGFYQISNTRDQRQDLPNATLVTDKTYYNLSLTQPVFHWNERRNNARIGALRKKIADEQYAEAYQILAQEIRSTYLQLIIKKNHVANTRNAMNLADSALALAQDKLAKKVTTEALVSQTQIENDQAHLGLDYAELEFAQLKQTFASLTGQPAPQDAAIPDEIYNLPSSQDEIARILAGFLAQKEPETRTASIMRKQVEVEDLNYRNSRKRLLPKFNFVAGMNQDEQSYTANLAAKYGIQSKFVGLQTTWNIFDGFATRGAIKSSLARKRQMEQNYQLFTESIGRDAQNAAKQADLAYRQMQINDRVMISSLNFLQYRQDDFKRGLASESDVAGAEATYKATFANAITSRYNYLMRVTEFVALLGQDPAVMQVAPSDS